LFILKTLRLAPLGASILEPDLQKKEGNEEEEGELAKLENRLTTVIYAVLTWLPAN